MIATLETTQSNTQQNKDQTYPPHTHTHARARAQNKVGNNKQWINNNWTTALE